MNDSVPVRPAATVALLRDTRAGLEVFLLRRNSRQVFGASAYVYPGGALDAADHEYMLQRHYADDSAARTEAIMDMRGALGYWAAASRECFEEAGVLVGCDVNSAIDGEALASARAQLNAGALSWSDLVRRMELHFDPGKLHYFAFWITPAGQPRRFSTRFFAARMPGRQQALADGSETTHGAWMRPAEALQRYAAGKIKLMRPTEETLRQFCEYDDVDSALADMDTRPIVPRP